jgi:prophage maintenance system killer protein/prophage antirepressor-like protein
MENEIIIFENQNVKLEVNMNDETVWLSQKQMSDLFGKSVPTINEHIMNIFSNKELDENSTIRNFRIVQKEGNRNVTRDVVCYNLDMIISVGYRVNSKQGIEFRKWATSVLKDYMLKGYAANEQRLKYLEKTVKLIDIAGRIEEELHGTEAQDIIKVINNYSNALNLLDYYDHRSLTKPKGTVSDDMITYDNCLSIIGLLRFNNDSDIFALERNKGLKSIIANIYQTFGGKDVYPTIEEKAANFLYLIIKNHTFIDGNKRIGATLFLYFLNFYGLLYREGQAIITPETLVAITLLIAQSSPNEKDIMIDLLLNIINGI